MSKANEFEKAKLYHSNVTPKHKIIKANNINTK